MNKTILIIIGLVCAVISAAAENKPEKSLLETTFAMQYAPSFNESADAFSSINTVINQVRGGYGGTLVCEPKNDILDSPAFLAYYLRAFSQPDSMDSNGLKNYDYRFERILTRLSRFPDATKDPRLDWDVFRAFLIYENSLKGQEYYYSEENGIKCGQGLSSPKDLLWSYINSNSEAILKDAKRLKWWTDNLAQDIENFGQYPLRVWYAMELVALSDQPTAKLIAEQEQAAEKSRESDKKKGKDDMFPPLTPNPYNLFMVIDEKDDAPRTFKEAIQKVAQSQKLGYECWGIDPDKTPAPKVLSEDLSSHGCVFGPIVNVISQESWSTKEQYFRVSLFRPIGRRGSYYDISLPDKTSEDGVFFFTYNLTLYVWPKARMNDAVIKMLLKSNLIDETTYKTYLEKGIKPLEITMSGKLVQAEDKPTIPSQVITISLGMLMLFIMWVVIFLPIRLILKYKNSKP